ncbi:cyclic nucleotide-binding domain-containing protein [Thermodesulfobacteriota bacterium]
MDYIHHVIGEKRVDIGRIQKILVESLSEKNIFCQKSRQKLLKNGLDEDEALMLLAFHKSKAKYGYDLSYDSLSHLFNLAKNRKNEAPLLRLFESPFLIVKTCWIYEHAPYFIFYNNDNAEELDDFIIKFAVKYDSLFLKQRIAIDAWKGVKDPKRVKTVTFWENQVFDPVSMIQKAKDYNIEGLELSIDYHPFNYTKLLPEELATDKREEIRQACLKSGIKIDIHSPIVGPYSPFPDPKRGKQLFYDPLNQHELMCETIELAKEIGAGSVVIHMIDKSEPEKIADLIMRAGGSYVRVTIENYCQTENMQNSDFLIAAIDEISRALPGEIRKRNFGITLDVGHLNIEGEDPLIGAEKVGAWCLANHIFFRIHATDNYGKLLFSPPAYSADVHGNISGRGINNAAVIKILRSMGHKFDVVAEQIRPLTPEDIDTIHKAQTVSIMGSYEDYVSKGAERLSKIGSEALITPEVAKEKAYQFFAGMEGISNLREHLVYRMIQDKKYLSVDEVKKISQEFMRMPQKYKKNMIGYIDDLLMPIQSESGVLQKNELDQICQNISGALFGTINNEHLDQIFSQTGVFEKDDLICEQNSIGKEMYLIKEGEVGVFINGSQLAVLGPGEIFGEISLFYNVRRTATIRAAKDNTTLGILTRERFEAMLKDIEPYSYDLIYRLYSLLPERMRNLNDKYKTAMDALKLIVDYDRGKGPILADFIKEKRPKTNFFPALTSEESGKVFRDLKTLDKDQLIFAEGDKADGAYYLLEGKVKAVTFSPDYEELLLGELCEGEIFGEMALIDDNLRSASILTITPCKVAFVNKKLFNELMDSHSELAFRTMAFICLSLFWRILRLDKAYADIKKAFE